MGYLESDELIGHTALRGFLARSVKNKRHHAFLLTGAEHLGKETIAKALVAEELDRPFKEWAELATHPDVRVLVREEDEKNIGIGQVRDFINHFSSSSMWGGRKIGVINGVHDLSVEAANALLKTLEEPSGKALLVLTAHSLERLPETIKSRCQVVRFLAVPFKELKVGLEGRGLSPERASSSALFSSGRPGLAITHAFNEELQKEHSLRVDSLFSILKEPISSRMAISGELTSKIETSVLLSMLDAWTIILRDALSIKMGNEKFAADRARIEDLRPYARRKKISELVTAIRTVVGSKRLLMENVNSRLVFENIALSL